MAILFSATLSAIGLFIIGAAITLFTGKNVLFRDSDKLPSDCLLLLLLLVLVILSGFP